jgi:hypothetical protein
MDKKLDNLVQEFLNVLESQEVKLLAWGVVDGGFSENEIEEIAEEFLNNQEADIDVGDFLDELIEERRVLFEFNLKGRRLFRTRMAESVRLFARLRQIFPDNKWQTAPTLVADYRFQIRPRVYPDRHISPAKAIAQLEAGKLLTLIKHKVVEAILCSPNRGELYLADFQLRATMRMLRDLNSTKSRGMIVCAGTGTGKTLAFYLPALAHIAGLVKNDKFWTKGLAIYPRNELLKDQFSETYIEARRLDAVLQTEGKRKIAIGAFFGMTPRKASLEDKQLNKWQSEGGGFTCPYLRCPQCDGTLSWRKADVEAGKERLFCTNKSCGTVIESDEVRLTRDRMAQFPPDLVFTTTEMLNRSMGDSYHSHVFGIGVAKPPQIVLLDEVHTYTGIHGAQVAYLLRRWQKLIAKKVHLTGLSATLESAEEFFSQLTNLSPGAVEEISPGKDLIAEGMEYQLVLRGDPVSGTSLLSTTIQTAMLLRRILDPAKDPPSQGFYGSRVFAFTDDLDVTNRLFHNLLDAEARDSWGRPLRRRQPLAALRIHGAANSGDRLVAGQSWHLCEEIGHTLQIPLFIGRTSSQDTGVDQNSDVIVATASLEVGYNDAEVGAVIQHKAPRDMASFLQRKGRAGRRRIMRPWTVVVLSDYGRDRIAYQGYDMLFNPVLEKRSLPIANRYVVRIQAVFAFMDWVAQQLAANAPKGNVWNDFASPPNGYHNIERRQRQEITLVENTLETEAGQRQLEAYLQSALGISQSEVDAILWEPPRPLMMAVLPTLLRRLKSGWKRVPIRVGESTQDYQVPFSPLPDFVPQSLFSDLLLPEVTITTPAQTRHTEEDINQMPIVQALKTFAPGRATRRFGVKHIHATHWIALPNLEEKEQYLAVESYCAEFEELGNFQLWEEGKAVDIRCIRPWELKPVQVPKNVMITSNAQLEWRSQIFPDDRGTKLDLPKGSPWCQIIAEVCCFTHTQQSPVEVRRFAIASHANLRIQQSKQYRELDATIRFTQLGNNLPASVGFVQSVDGLVFCFRIPDSLKIDFRDANQQKIRALRTAYFHDRILTDTRLGGIANSFQRDWLYQIYLSMLTTRALADKISLIAAFADLKDANLGEEMAKVLENIFQTLNVEETLSEAETDSESDQVQGRQRVHDRLLNLCNSEAVQTILNDLASVLWEDPDEGWHNWAVQRFKATLGGALLDACGQLCPEFDAVDLILDVDAGFRPSDAPPIPEKLEEIWITESAVGGGGTIEEIVRRYAADPANFFRLARSALDPSDFEIVDSELTRLLELTETSAEVPEAMAGVRSAEGYNELKQASDRLRKVLSSLGILATHPVMTAINARILRPGSNQATDKLLLDLIRSWHTEEERLGIEIDARVFAYTVSESDRLDRALLHLGLVQPNPYWRFQVIYGLLWLRGNILRSRALSSYNPFAILPDADRELLLDVLQADERMVWLHDPNWREQVEDAFRQGMSVSLIAQLHTREALKLAMLDLVSEPINIGFLQLYPQLEGIHKHFFSFIVRLHLREKIQ